jgi:acetylornithine deacetylase
LFQDGGSPSVVIGPGDIAQAHTADEWIAKDQIEKCSGFLTRLADWAEN